MEAYKVLGQLEAVTADTDFSLYTVPTATKVALSKLIIAAKVSNSKYRVSVVPNGDTLAGKHAVIFDSLIEANKSIPTLQGVSLNAGDQIMVRANTGASNLSFSLFGVEIT